MVDYKKEFAELLEMVSKEFSPEDVEKVKNAFAVAEKAHGDQKRCSGEPYIIHPIAVAKILAETKLDSSAICAALLHDVVEDTDMTSEDIRRMFGRDVEVIVDGVTKIDKLPFSKESDEDWLKEKEQNENIKKMILAMSEEIRVVIVKLADRVHNMRTLEFMPEEKRRRISRETLEIYASLANRLGIRAFKDELEDRAIRYLDPVTYEEISNSLKIEVDARREFIEYIQKIIKEKISEEYTAVHIEGRVKSVHSIYRKTILQGKTLDEIHDIYAVRLIVDTTEQCYGCLGFIHEMFNPIPGRFKDYISTPKPNGYQSLHTTVIGKEGIPFEVQIRTWEMHHTAEYGVAAHWKYKEGGGKDDAKFMQRLAWIRQLIENQKNGDAAEDIVQMIKNDLAPEEVFAFTPKGDVISLPIGSCIIDFAYAIHSAVGNKMIGAKVNGRIVTLDYKIDNGEIIEILTTSQQGKGPSRDWIKFAATSSARTKIRSWFKKEKREENILEGKAEVEREFKRNNIVLPEKQMVEFISQIAEKQHCNTVDDFFAAIGYGGISLTKLIPRIKENYAKIIKEAKSEDTLPPVQSPRKKYTKSTDGIIVEGIDNCLVKFARCCDPLPGDEIIGFITRGHGVSIHTKKCSNVPKNIVLSPEPERWVNAYWDTMVSNSYRVTLSVTCMNRVGMLADISSVIANMHVMIHNIFVKEGKDGRSTIFMTITVNGAEHLKSICEKLKKVKGVLTTERSAL